MANTYKNIVITPNRSSNTADPKVVYSGGNTTANTDITLNVYPDSNGTLSWEGSAGQLFSITNDLSNNLFGVNDVSGIPYIEVYANSLVSIAPLGGNVVIGNTAKFIFSSATGLFANGSTGTAGQALTTNGSAVYWSTISGVNTAAQYTWTNTHTFQNTITFSSLINTAAINITGQTNTATLFVTTSANIASSNIIANTAGLFVTNTTGVVNAAVHSVGTSFIANTTQITIAGIPLSANGGVGTAGQVLTTNGATGAPYWTTAAAGVNTAATYTWTNTHTYQNSVIFNSNVLFRNNATTYVGNTTGNGSVITLYVYPDSNGTLSWEGNAGQLFSITNDLSNNLFGVNDVSGIPSLEIYANGLVSIAPISGNVGVRNTAPSHTMSINGDLLVNTDIDIGNTSVNAVINSTAFLVGNVTTGTGGLQANTTRILIGNNSINAAVNTTTLSIGGTLIANSTGPYGKTEGNLNVNSALTSNNSSFLGGNSASDLRTYSDNKAANAYSNAVSYVDGKSYVNTSQLSSNLSNYQTTAGLAGNVALLAANSATYLGNTSGTIANVSSWITTNAATAYSNSVSYTDSKILTANAAITGNAATAYTNAIAFASNASNINTGTLAEARLPFRMDQNVTTSNNVTFGSLTLTGNLTVTGNVTVIGANALSVVDNMIYLNANNTTQNIDVGIVANYNSGAYAHTGIFRDASDGYWKVFDSYLPEPDANVNIDTTNTSFHLADFQANTFYAGNTSTNWFIANTAGVYHTGLVNAASFRVGTSTIANSTGVYTGVVNGSSITIGTAFTANATIVNAVSYYAGTTLIGNTTGPYGKTEGSLNVNSALTANNSTNLGGTAAASYQLNSTLSANIASYLPTYTGVVNGSSHTVGTAFTANATLTNTVSLVVSTNTSTFGTTVYIVANGNVGIGNSTPADKLVVAGSIIPSLDNSYNLGSASLRWANLYTGDLHLSNEKTIGNIIDGTTGNWTIQEGETELYIINNKNGKKFKFKLEEI